MQIVGLPDGLPIDYTIQLANALSKREKVMIVLSNNPQLEEHIENIGKDVNLCLTQKIKYPHWRHPSNLLIPFNIIRKIRQFKPDMIHVQGGDLLSILILPFLKKYPLVTTIHDPKPHIGDEKLLIKKITLYYARKYSDQIIVHGEKLKEQMINEYNIPKEKVHVIPIGEHEVATFKIYERKEIKEDGNLILFFGRIWKYKGLEYLIKAEPLITKEVPYAKIIIAGTGEDFKKYENMMINRNKFILYNYHIPYKEGAELFQRCSVVVLPYIEASQSGVIPPAYSFKKPVVVTDVGAMPEIVDDEVTGFIVPPRNPEALAEKIVKIDLSWDTIAEKTIEVYKKAIKEHKKGE
jgi:glycosyltransferase involved in cell wall biosynthesis